MFDASEAILIENQAKYWLLGKTYNKEVSCYNLMGEY